jgi:preprotein translocase subunit SecF
MSAPTLERPPTTPKRRRHTLSDIFHERTHFQFIERSWRWGVLSGIAILISVVALLVSGLNLGIDFDGGTQWEFTVAKGSPSTDAVRKVVDPLGLGDAKILIVGGDHVRVQSKVVNDKTTNEVQSALAKFANTAPKNVSISTVGPTWGDTVSNKALTGLIVFFGLIALYLTFRFEWKMALAAIIAVIHDIIITVGVYAVTGFEVTPGTVVAFLTILGFSLYDTVVVFDKVKENTSTIGTERGDTYSRMVNRSMNQVLMRSLNTSFVALLPVASLLFVGSGIMGAITLRDFALALFVGLLTGAYSSIFVATPILAYLKEREPRYRALRERSAAQLARDEADASAGARTPKRQPARAGVAARPAGRTAEPAEVTGSGPDGGEVFAGAGRSEADEPGADPADAALSDDEPADDEPADDEPAADELPEDEAGEAPPRPAPRAGSATRTPAGGGGVAPRPRQQRRRKRR